MLIDLETYTPNFIAMVEKEINRIKGGNRYVGNECGEYTKLLLPEATILAYRFVGRVIRLTRWNTSTPILKRWPR